MLALFLETGKDDSRGVRVERFVTLKHRRRGEGSLKRLHFQPNYFSYRTPYGTPDWTSFQILGGEVFKESLDRLLNNLSNFPRRWVSA